VANTSGHNRHTASGPPRSNRDQAFHVKVNKDNWDKVGVFVPIVNGLVVAAVGFFLSHALSTRQAHDSDSRSYSDLATKREDSEASIRRELLDKIAPSLFSPVHDFDTNMYMLKFVAYNYNESFDLRPMFEQIRSAILRSESGNQERYLRDLDSIVREVKQRQMAVLEAVGKHIDRDIGLDVIPGSGSKVLKPFEIKLEGVKRNFSIKLLALPNKRARELSLLCHIETESTGPTKSLHPEAMSVELTTGMFDLPMIITTRLSLNQRLAIIVRTWDETKIELTTVVFPGLFSGGKVRAYYPDMLMDLKRFRDEPVDR